jgi:hypothetical protein
VHEPQDLGVCSGHQKLGARVVEVKLDSLRARLRIDRLCHPRDLGRKLLARIRGEGEAGRRPDHDRSGIRLGDGHRDAQYSCSIAMP